MREEWENILDYLAEQNAIIVLDEFPYLVEQDESLPFDAAMEFFDDAYTADKQVLTWGVFGGVPYYLEEVSPDATLAENVQRTILSRHGTLHDEPDYCSGWNSPNQRDISPS